MLCIRGQSLGVFYGYFAGSVVASVNFNGAGRVKFAGNVYLGQAEQILE